jgi:hypothetical protein
MQRRSIELSPVDKTKQALASAIVLDDGQVQSHLVIDGDLVDDYTNDEREADRDTDVDY